MLRLEAQKLLDTSCHLQPVRDPICSTYAILPASHLALPETNDSVAQMLYANRELRAAVGAWTASSLDGWHLDLKQSLDVFQIMARRGGREGNLADSGQGIQQVLPVAALCCWRKLIGRDQPFQLAQPRNYCCNGGKQALGIQPRRCNS